MHFQLEFQSSELTSCKGLMFVGDRAVAQCVISQLEQITAHLPAPQQACAGIYDRVPLSPLLCEPVSAAKSCHWGFALEMGYREHVHPD